MMEVNRAMADLAEVRTRLAAAQRFRGISGVAAIVSGVVAFGTGAYQAILLPAPQGALEDQRYLAIWISCLVFALLINYGAIGVWLARNWSSRSRSEFRSVGMTILPAILLGGVATLALVHRSEFSLLPGLWCGAYAIGLFASRAMLPRGAAWIAFGFGCASALLFVSEVVDPLAWFVMSFVFGAGQIAIGALVLRDREENHE
jgi:hypothetical protein